MILTLLQNNPEGRPKKKKNDARVWNILGILNKSRGPSFVNTGPHTERVNIFFQKWEAVVKRRRIFFSVLSSHHPVVWITSHIVSVWSRKNEALSAGSISWDIVRYFKNLNGMGCLLMITEVVRLPLMCKASIIFY